MSPAACRGAGSLPRVKPRLCSRSGCRSTALATLTYAYADRAAVVGPLALRAEPGTYDLCREHCVALSTPRGWELIRLPLDEGGPAHTADDLLALADAVREVGLTWDEPRGQAPAAYAEPVTGRRKGHLAVVADPADQADAGGRRGPRGERNR